MDLILSNEEILLILQRSTGNSYFQLIDYQLTPYSKEKIGYMGSHDRLVVTVQDTNNKKMQKFSYFVKGPHITAFENQDGAALTFFESESFFYDKIVPDFRKGNDTIKWTADCYLVNKKCIVLEDLGLRGYKMSNYLYDEEKLKTALVALANFHASSILTETRLKKPLDKIYPNFSVDMSDPESESDAFVWIVVGAYSVASVAKKFNLKNIEKIEGAILKRFTFLRQSKIYQNVLCHGDLWGSNILFDDSKSKNCVLVDYQLVGYRPIAIDLLLMMYNNTDRNFRKQYERDMLKHYHRVLEDTVKKNNSEAKVPELSEILASYEELRLYGPISASLLIPLTQMDPEIAHYYTKDSKSHCEFMYNKDRRTEAVMHQIEKSDSYRDRIKECIEELLKVAERA